MASIKKRMDAKQRKEVIQALRAISERIKSGDLEIVSFGFWAGLPGSWNLKLSVNETDKLEKSK